jgi:hypothetical protein
MAIPGIQEIQALATKYSKPQLQKMAQMGLVDPTKAVMAGMMIDRIQKQNMQPPQQTVAEEVMGGPPPMPEGAPAPEQAPQAAGIAGLPSGLPPQMAGGGIVAFAEGGDTEEYAGGGVVAMAGGGMEDFRRDPASRVDPRVQAARDKDRYFILSQELADAQRRAQAGDPRAAGDVEAIRREMRTIKPQSSGIDLPGISSAQAAEVKPAAPKSSAPVKSAEDAVYSPEGVLLFGEPPTEPAVRKTKPGERIEPNLLRDILEGRPNEPLPKIERRTPAPAPAAEAPPKVAEKPAEKPAAKEEMGPARPSTLDRLRNVGLEEPKELSAKEALAEQDAVYGQLGVEKDLFAKIRQDYEGTRGKFKDRADKAAGHALMMFGAGLLGARRGAEFETASKAAQQSLMMYMGTMDKISDQEDKLSQALRELSVSEDQYKRTRAESSLARVQKNRDKIDNIRLENAKLELTAQAKAAEFAVEELKAENPAQWVTIKNIAKSSGKEPVEVFMMANGVAKTGNLTLNQALEAVQRNPMFMGKTPAEQMQEAQRMVGGGGGGGATYNYVPGKGLVPAQ